MIRADRTKLEWRAGEIFKIARSLQSCRSRGELFERLVRGFASLDVNILRLYWRWREGILPLWASDVEASRLQVFSTRLSYRTTFERTLLSVLSSGEVSKPVSGELPRSEVEKPLHVKEFLVLPLYEDNDPRGLLVLASTRKTQLFSKIDILLLEMLGVIIETAVKGFLLSDALMESRERYGEVLHALGDAIVITDGGRIVDSNPAWAKLSGLANSKGRIFDSLAVCESRNSYDEPYEAVLTVPERGEIKVEVNSRKAHIGGRDVEIHVIRDLTERNRAREELDYRSRLLESVFTSSTDGILLIDLEGRIEYANPAALEKLSLVPDEPGIHLIGNHLRFTSAGNIKNWSAVLKRVSQGGRVVIADARPVARPGEGSRVKVIPRYRAKKVIGAVVTLEDRSAEERLKALFAEEQKKFDLTLGTVGAGIIMVDRSRRITWANKGITQLFPHLSKENGGLVGKVCHRVLWMRDYPCDGCVADRTWLDSSAHRKYCEGPPGSEAEHIMVTTSFLEEGDGEPATLLEIFQDVTDLFKTKKELAQTKERLLSLFENSTDLFFTLDSVGRFTSLNSSLERLFEISRSDWVGRLFEDLIHLEDRPLVEKALAKSAIGETAEGEIRGFSSSGRPLVLAVTFNPLKNDGRVREIFAVGRDITQQRALEKRLMISHRLSSLGELASGVAHDFNNVLTVVSGRAQLLLSKTDDQFVRKCLEVILKATADGVQTVRRIQEFAKQQSTCESFETLDLNMPVEEAIEFVNPRLNDILAVEGRKIQIEFYKGKELFIEGNRRELREVMVNLLLNAIDAMPEGGKIEIRTGPKDEGHVFVEVADEGVGIPPEIVGKVFDPFFTTKGTGGTGLGLSISYAIVERHRGTIEVTSTGGHGSVFLLEFPRSRKTSIPGAGEIAADREMISIKAGSLLIVDDDPDICDFLSEILAEAGHRTLKTCEPATALELVERNRPELAVIDLRNGVSAGLELAAQIKARDNKISILLITDWRNEPAEKELKQAGVAGVITRPFDSAELIRNVNELVNVKKL